MNPLVRIFLIMTVANLIVYTLFIVDMVRLTVRALRVAPKGALILKVLTAFAVVVAGNDIFWIIVLFASHAPIDSDAILPALVIFSGALRLVTGGVLYLLWSALTQRTADEDESVRMVGEDDSRFRA